MFSRKAFRVAALLSTALLLSALLGLGCKKEEPAAPAKEPAAASAKAAPAPEAKSAEAAKPIPGAADEKKRTAAEKKKALMERAEKTYRAAFCAVQAGRPDAADKAYTDHEFKSPSHFHRLWKRLADKEPDWAKRIVTETDEKSCESKK
jgi:hypothetical protein